MTVHKPNIGRDERRRDRAHGGKLPHREANRKDATGTLVHMIKQAAFERAVRAPTRPALASKQRRLTGKSKRGEVKRQRRLPGLTGD